MLKLLLINPGFVCPALEKTTSMKKHLFKRFTKVFVSLSVLALSFSTVKAQNAADYGFQAFPGAYVPLENGTEVFEVEDDDMSSFSMIDIGFTFNFCGTPYTQVKPNSNGWLSFADVFPQPWEMRDNESYNVALMTPMVMPLWDDLSGYPWNSGYFAYETIGTPPNRTFVAEWRNWMWIFFLGTPTISYQVRLHETSDVIDFVYRQEPGNLDGFSEAATVGIANNDADFQVLEDMSTSPTTTSFDWVSWLWEKPATGQVYRWTPPSACGGTPTAGDAVAAEDYIACEGETTVGLQNTQLGDGIEYQWEYSTDGTNWNQLGGPNTYEYANTGILTETTEFRCVVTCTASGESATSTSVTITIGGPIAGNAVATPELACYDGNSEISLTGNTTNGVEYVWESSADGTNFNPISGATSSTYDATNLTSTTYYRAVVSCASSGASNTSTDVEVNTTPNNAPSINGGPITITCGDPAVLTATPSPGSSIIWFDQPTGGNMIASGSSAVTFPTATTTYYAANSLQTQVFAGTLSLITYTEHASVTGDDHGGIALSSNYVYYTGDQFTGRFDKADLNNPTSLQLRDGFFGDMGSGQLWQLGNATTAGGTFAGAANVDRLYTLDENLELSGNEVALSQPIFLDDGWNGQSLIAPGEGYVLLFDGVSEIFKVDLGTGQVTSLATGVSIPYYWSETWAVYGWAEFDGTDYYIIFCNTSSSELSKMNVTTGTITPLATYSSVDMSQAAYDKFTGNIYVHHEYQSDWNSDGGSETVAILYLPSAPSCDNTLRVPITVTVDPITATITPSGIYNMCVGGNTLLTASAGASYQWFLGGSPIPGATNSTYNATAAGNYTVEVTSGNGCVGASPATTINTTAPQPVSVSIAANPGNTACNGATVTFTATPTNGGLNTSYQWKKNGVNVGTNSPTYATPALVNGDQINVVMTVGPGICPQTPTATSNTITMTINPNVAPTITINANPGISACEDDAIAFSTTFTNSGTAPGYQWQVNGTNVGGNSPTYNAPVGSLNTGDIVSVTMNSNQACALPTAVTQSVVMTVDPLVTPVATITASETDICLTEQVTFTATDNAPGGTYQWLVNGNPSGPNNATYTYAPAVGDVISLTFTPPTAGCYVNTDVTTPGIAMNVTPGLPTQATVNASPLGAVQGQNIVLEANLFNFGTNYTIEWYINGVLFTTTNVPFTNYTKGAGTDDIYIIASGGGGCFDVATSPTISVVEWPASVGTTASNVNVEIFPNPFNSTLTVKGLDNGDEIRLMNMLGQTIQVWNPEKVATEEVLKVTDLAAGSYLISIRNKDGVTRKIEKLQKL